MVNPSTKQEVKQTQIHLCNPDQVAIWSLTNELQHADQWCVPVRHTYLYCIYGLTVAHHTITVLYRTKPFRTVHRTGTSLITVHNLLTFFPKSTKGFPSVPPVMRGIENESTSIYLHKGSQRPNNSYTELRREARGKESRSRRTRRGLSGGKNIAMSFTSPLLKKGELMKNELGSCHPSY